MADYYLRNVPDDLWKKVKKRAKHEGHSVHWLLLGWLRLYVAGELSRYPALTESVPIAYDKP